MYFSLLCALISALIANGQILTIFYGVTYPKHAVFSFPNNNLPNWWDIMLLVLLFKTSDGNIVNTSICPSVMLFPKPQG